MHPENVTLNAEFWDQYKLLEALPLLIKKAKAKEAYLVIRYHADVFEQRNILSAAHEIISGEKIEHELDIRFDINEYTESDLAI